MWKWLECHCFRSNSEREAMKKIKSTQLTRTRITDVREGLGRFALPLLGGIIALSLAGCETRSSSSNGGLVGSLFGSSSNEQPAVTGSTERAAQLAAQAKPLTFAPVIGAPAKISSTMSEKLVAAATQKNLKVESSNSSGYTVRGYLVAASAQSGTKLSYIWDIRDQSGKRAKRFQGDELIEGKKGGDPWALVDDAAIDKIAASTADKISAWMYGEINTAASAEPVQAEAQKPEPTVQQTSYAERPLPSQEPKPVQQTASANVLSTPPQQPAAPSAPAEIVAVVSPVTGAPGDGEQSLTTAMRRHLTNAGVKLVEGSSASAYTVKGTVQLGSADGGQQPITIRWQVVDPAGKQIDKAVVQRNKIPAGSLDGPWGKVADLAASEAAKSIAKLIQPTG
jgi:hypothetical protein